MKNKEGYLVGYRLDCTHFVVSTIIRPDKQTAASITLLIKQTTKLNAFNSYCVSEPQVLGYVSDQSKTRPEDS